MNNITESLSVPSQIAKTWTDVCQLDQLVPDRGACAFVNGESVALFRLSGTDELYALSNWDPCSRISVLSRGIVGDRKGTAVVVSPIYKQAFDLRTGECLDDPSVRVPTFAVRVRDNMVQVRARGDSLSAAAPS